MSLTKAQRKARQRQRSSLRKEDLPRTPSGALSRSSERYRIEGEITQKDATIVVMQARQRVNGLNAEAAATAEAGSAVGRLLLARKITKRLYEAANRFDEDVCRYYAMTGIPHPSPRGSWSFVAKAEPVREEDRDKSIGISLRAMYGENSAEYSESVKYAASRYMLAIGVVQQVDRSGRPVESALRHAVIMDHSIDNWPPHMIGLLVIGLKALADHYGIQAYEDELVLTRARA